MKKLLWFFAFPALGTGLCVAQTSTCKVINSPTYSYCPNPGCHERFPRTPMSDCYLGEVCSYVKTQTFCCGAYQIQVYGGSNCIMTEYRDQKTSSKVLELARENEILIPSCSGALVPARLVLRSNVKHNSEKDEAGGGL
jgi:hypothetical protein